MDTQGLMMMEIERQAAARGFVVAEDSEWANKGTLVVYSGLDAVARFRYDFQNGYGSFTDARTSAAVQWRVDGSSGSSPKDAVAWVMDRLPASAAAVAAAADGFDPGKASNVMLLGGRVEARFDGDRLQISTDVGTEHEATLQVTATHEGLIIDAIGEDGDVIGTRSQTYVEFYDELV